MRKTLVSILTAVALLLLPATPAVAAAPSPWSPWAPSPTPPFTRTGLCTAEVGFTFPVDEVVQRTRTDPGGNTEIQSKGRLVVTLTPLVPGTPRHHTFDISGPSLGKNTQIAYLNGDYLYRATGASVIFFFGTAVEGTGMPRLALTRGPIAILYTGTEKADVITRPRTVIDLCARMGLGTAVARA